MGGSSQFNMTFPMLVGIIIAGILLADVMILVRWLFYQYHVNQEVALVEANGEVQEITDIFETKRPLPTPSFRTSWSLIDPFLGFQAALLFVSLLALIPQGIIMARLLKSGGISDITARLMSDPWMIASTIFILYAQNGLFVGVVAFYLKRYGTSLRGIGLRPPTLKEVGLGVGLGFSMLAVANGLESLQTYLLPHLLSAKTIAELSALTESFSAGSMFTKIHSPIAIVLFAIAGGLMAPIGEEVFFRGLLYNCLKRQFSIRIGIVGSGLCFALIHISPLAIPIIFLMGMFLALVYEKTKSLWVTILIHAINNSAIFFWLAIHPATAAK